jgi:hypothetical protein
LALRIYTKILLPENKAYFTFRGLFLQVASFFLSYLMPFFLTAFLSFFFFAVLGLELRAYTLSQPLHQPLFL